MINGIEVSILVLYASIAMSRRYHYSVIYYMFSKEKYDSILEIIISFISWTFMSYLFYYKSLFFFLFKLVDVISIYFLNANFPERQSETCSSYLERVTIRSNNNAIEASQFEAFIDTILFALFWGVNYVWDYSII